MKDKDKIKIGLASIWAGGGHNELRDILYEELKKDNSFDLSCFTHSDSSYNWFNDNVFGFMPKYLNFIYKSLPNDYPGISALNLIKECDNFVQNFNPDIVISSNFGVCSAFQFIKKTLKKNFINIYAIPDYGHTGRSIFPQNPYFKPDYVIVFDIETKKGLIDDMNYPAEKIIVTGSIARESFRELINKYRYTDKNLLIDNINSEINDDLIKKDKRTIILSGGSGGIINKSFRLLKSIAKNQKENTDLIYNSQYLIITGQNNKFRDKINKLRLKNSYWSNILPIPWVNQETYSKLMLISQFPILITIAPATINQLLTAECGPFIIFHYRTGPELENAEFTVKEGIGFEVNNCNKVLQIINKGFSDDEINNFKINAREHLKLRSQLLEQLPNTIRNIYINRNIEYREDKKLKLNYDLISPKILWTIFILLIPSSLIYAYAQYFKGKRKIIQNPTIQKILEMIKW